MEDSRNIAKGILWGLLLCAILPLLMSCKTREVITEVTRPYAVHDTLRVTDSVTVQVGDWVDITEEMAALYDGMDSLRRFYGRTQTVTKQHTVYQTVADTAAIAQALNVADAYRTQVDALLNEQSELKARHAEELSQLRADMQPAWYDHICRIVTAAIVIIILLKLLVWLRKKNQ